MRWAASPAAAGYPRRVGLTVMLAVGLFVATNIDNLVTITAVIAGRRAEGLADRWTVWVGQCAGMILIVVVALLGAAGFAMLPMKYIALIGLLPIMLGINGLRHALRRGDDEGHAQAPMAAGVLGVIGLTVANGADNVAAYVPAFRRDTLPQLAVTLCVFAVGACLWCVLGGLCAAHPFSVKVIARAGRWLVPVIFILVGVGAITAGLGWR